MKGEKGIVRKRGKIPHHRLRQSDIFKQRFGDGEGAELKITLNANALH